MMQSSYWYVVTYAIIMAVSILATSVVLSITQFLRHIFEWRLHHSFYWCTQYNCL